MRKLSQQFKERIMEINKAIDILQKGIAGSKVDACQYREAYEKAIKSLKAWKEVKDYGLSLIEETKGSNGSPRWVEDNAQIYCAGVMDLLNAIEVYMGEKNGEKR